VQERIIRCHGILDLRQPDGTAVTADFSPLLSVPQAVFDDGFAAEIVELRLARNQLKELPISRAMTKLTLLDVAGNQVAAVPDAIGELPSLTHLDVSENGLRSISPAIGNLKHLSVLLAFKNELTAIPDELGGCEALAEVNFFNNRLIKLPPTMAGLKHLEDINVGSNKLKTLPEPSWPECNRIAIQWNNIVLLPSLQGVPNCKILLMAGNSHLAQFPKLPRGLEMIDCSGCAIESLGNDIPAMRGLKQLNATRNKLTMLPDVWGEMRSLESLQVGSNALSAVSKGIADCPSLRVLFLQSNQIKQLPAEMRAMRSLHRINLDRNPIDENDENKETVAALRTIVADSAGFIRVPHFLG